MELQDGLLAGGIVVRRFEPLAGAGGGGRAAEARVWLDGAPVAAGPHPDTPGRLPQPRLDHIGALVAALGCRLVTTDVARRADGAWRVIEVGDGQVSDWSPSVDPGVLAAALLHAPAGYG